jgi:hypothetical protein
MAPCFEAGAAAIGGRAVGADGGRLRIKDTNSRIIWRPLYRAFVKRNDTCRVLLPIRAGIERRRWIT